MGRAAQSPARERRTDTWTTPASSSSSVKQVSSVGLSVCLVGAPVAVSLYLDPHPEHGDSGFTLITMSLSC